MLSCQLVSVQKELGLLGRLVSDHADRTVIVR